ncbi:outer membrane lipoprotein LolB [Verminephrobacter aporrectodeae subsp. tuberculatae]|uniref:lipoprotein insertase outer membrane protein LolB n=2 Tax=Verminephrobacter aporrectodeae TaxID=1110389 RepID=UPI002237B93A|nr:lipoprotein insertase outer membrane protein LolB [Verminephrobacter aporrectodeae]MCW5221249.1 outer membrane lipoprotein LolB [Verminephrobacter aporrectodeae subsp. tuberculatae]MCW5290540.1 outer membrane lipoprotein LolB [Verminephrobacter aporrectodeae subsp. tuberculatae]
MRAAGTAPWSALRARAMPHRLRWKFWPALCLLWLAGCAQLTPGPAAREDAWSGRIALQVQGPSAQSFSALFELHGNARSGGLVLLSPLGNRLAQLDWRDGHAQLRSARETRSSDSLDALLQDVTGTRIPVAALFSWLKGNPATVAGWQADLSGIAEGRLSARLDDPAAQASLRIVLTR